MTGGGDVAGVVYVAYDLERRVEREYELVRQRPEVVFVNASGISELAGALRIPSRVTIISAHGHHRPPAGEWGISRYDGVTQPIRPSDLVTEAGSLGARNLVVIACDIHWARGKPDAPSPAEREWRLADTRDTRLFITQGEITYDASRGLISRLLAMLEQQPCADVGDLIRYAREQFGHTLKPGLGRTRIRDLGS